jgi:ATP-dependent Lon protease
MTGEITLRGEVLPIGGLKEKLLAAHRGGIDTVLIPQDNERDLTEIPRNIKQNLEIRPVRWIDEVLDVALSELPEMKAVGPEEAGPGAAEESNTAAPKVEQKEGTGVRTHH